MSRILESVRPAVGLQKNSWSCSVAALRHALLVHGYRISMRRLSKLVKPTKMDGADETKIRTAAEALGFRFIHAHYMTAELAKESIRCAKHPTLVPVDRDTHWVAVVKSTSRHVWVCDGARTSHANVTEASTNTVLQRWTWRFLLSKIQVWKNHENHWNIYWLCKG